MVQTEDRIFPIYLLIEVAIAGKFLMGKVRAREMFALEENASLEKRRRAKGTALEKKVRKARDETVTFELKKDELWKRGKGEKR
ncbi:Hypothetical protein NTJ_11018 [Nesidiocoris tenuis]|uniref:Uncharacterized protein n=1 Tax=Nesidiocoris tenuis TaxID=355587 RepID=A0ABN7B1A5_9HEMI|nr:Hypothetical protein NTJ_11018 [Nesidiocoris tenuis]